MMKQNRNGLADVLVSSRLAAGRIALPLTEDLTLGGSMDRGSMFGEDILALGLLGGATALPAVPKQDDDAVFGFALPEAAKRPAADDEDEDDEDEDEDEDDDEDDEEEDEEDDLDEDEDDDLDDDEDEEDDDEDDEDDDEDEDDDFLDDDDDDDYDDEEEDFAGEDE